MRNLDKVMTEVYKSLNCLNYVGPIHRVGLTHDLRAKNLLQLPKARIVLNVLNSILFRGNILWSIVPDEIKSSQSIVSWDGHECKCIICN